jgi:hypothetical protein
MERALVRAVASVFIGLIVILSAPLIGSATLPNRAEQRTAPPYEEWWEQWVVKDRVRFLYNPNDFIAGTDAAYVEVQDLTKGKLAVDFAKSDFLQPQNGLNKKGVSQELDGFYVRIPKGVRTGDYPYYVKFACRHPSGNCPYGIFYVPVKSHTDQLLDVKLTTERLYIPVVAESSEFEIELHARKRIRRVRLIPNPAQWGAAGVASFELRQRTPDGSVATKEMIEITPGDPFHGWVRVTGARGVYWNHLVSDWRGSPPEITLMFEYNDEYDRHWVLRSAPSKFEYQLPSWGVPLYYLILLGLATAAGIGGRFVAVTAVGTLRTGTKGWVYALLLAALLFVLGHVLHARIEPVGLFQLDVTNLRGILTTGLVAGFVPELIRGRIQAILGAPR